MKKTLKAALSILLVLALLTALPLTVMADTQTVPDNTTTKDPPMNVTENQEMGKNTGTIGTNKGTITNNGVQPAEGKPADPSSGTVNSNGYGGTIQNNYGTVVQNGASSGSPTINNNYGLVLENYGDGKVNTNQSGGIVTNNHSDGTVTDNFGYVGNNADGKVTNNKNGGEVSNNGGTVGTNESGGVVNNNGGTVGTNENGGVVNNESGTVIRNASAGNGEGTVGVTNNGGTVETNEVGGVVDNCKGTVNINKGKVVYNGIEGTVNNVENGTVKYNLGTVVDTDGKTYYGLHGWYKDEDNVDTEHPLGSYEAGAEIDLDQKVAGITREGFKLTKYEIQVYEDGQFSDYTPNEEAVARANVDAGDGGGDGEGGAAKPLYRISAPTLLKLYWEQIVSIFKPAASSGGGAEAVPTSYNPKYIGLGSVIFINEKGYKVVEIKDDAYVVVSFDALSDEDVQDLDALYAKLFTPEQQKLIKNVGQLLDSEDVLTVFGKPGNHPVFEISKALTE